MHGNADVVQPGTIEMWDSLGLREQLMRAGHPIYAYVRPRPTPHTAL